VPVYSVLGQSILHPQEYRQQAAEIVNLESAEVTAFAPIGMHKPLTIQIRHVYTGKFPKLKFLSANKDMLVTSALKDVVVFNAATRAVNFLRKGVAQNSSMNSPAATEQGTPLVAYLPAVTSPSTILTLEIVFDEFPDALFGKVSTALSSLAGLPIFLPASGYLMASSSVVKLAGNLGQALFDGKPVFSATETLDFDMPGATSPEAEFRVICNPDFDPTPFRFEPKQGLLDRATGAPYRGDEPYIVLSLDGKQRDQFAGFAPTAASATILEKFFNVKDGTEAVLDTLLESMKLLSDSKFRSQADAVKRKLDASPPGSDEAKALKDRYDALLANILTDTMKPK
jgi:hypothetical protein